MIWGRFEEPNFKFAALDEQGKNVSYFCRAQSEQELRKRLMVKGLRVLAIEPYQFSEWKDRARVATDKAIWQRIRDRWVHFGPQIRKVFPWLSDADLVNIAGLKKSLYRPFRCMMPARKTLRLDKLMRGRRSCKKSRCR